MGKHRNPKTRPSKQPTPDNRVYGALVRRLYANAVELEALSVMADEAAGTLPPTSSVKRRQLYARISTLVHRIADQASSEVERVEELVSMHAANLAAQAAKRSPVRRAR